MAKVDENWEDTLNNWLNESDDFDNELVNNDPQLLIDLDEINNEARKMASMITERLSNYYFDETYIENHPYIPTKIMSEMDNIRRLIKMLSVNEKAQDALIASITLNAGKGTLYSSLTSLQNSMLSIQTQLNNLTSSLEDIFKEMQEECEKTFAEKEKETNDDGSVTVRGSREFIKQLNEQLKNGINKPFVTISNNDENKDEYENLKEVL